MPKTVFLVFLSMMFFAGNAYSNTEITSFFSKNATLLDSEDGGTSDSGYVTTISPGIIVDREGSRSSLSLSYQLDAVYYRGFDNREEDSNVVQLLDFFTDYEHRPGKWISSLQANSRLTNIDVNGRQNANHVFIQDNTDELRTLEIDTEVNDKLVNSVDYRTRVYANYATYADSDDGDDTRGKGLLLGLNNFRTSGDFTWGVELSSDLVEDDIDETQLDVSNILLGYKISSIWSSFIEHTRTELDSPRLTDNVTLIGVTWRPNRRSFISLGAGKRDEEDSYSFAARSERKRVTYSATYDEDITTARSDVFDQILENDLGSATTQSISISPVLQKRATFNIEASGKFSTYRLSFFDTDRSGSSIDPDETVTGIVLSYDYEFCKRDQISVRLLGQEVKSVEESTLLDLGATYSRLLPRSETMDIGFGWAEQDSTEAEDEYKLIFVSAAYRITF